MKLENLNTMEGQLKLADALSKFLIKQNPQEKKLIQKKLRLCKKRILNKNMKY